MWIDHSLCVRYHVVFCQGWGESNIFPALREHQFGRRDKKIFYRQAITATSALLGLEDQSRATETQRKRLYWIMASGKAILRELRNRNEKFPSMSLQG